jgi:hypothetical protein
MFPGWKAIAVATVSKVSGNKISSLETLSLSPDILPKTEEDASSSETLPLNISRHTILLAELPIELLLGITDFLSLRDATCLSLCNHRLLATLERRISHLQRSRLPSRSETLSILKRLQRDLPSYFLCYACHRLRKCDKSPVLYGSTLEDECALPDFPKWKKNKSLALSFGESWRDIKYQFYHLVGESQQDIKYQYYFFHLQLAMRSFYHGPQFGFSTEALSHTQVQVYPEDISILFSVEAQICTHLNPPQLLLRTQEIRSTPIWANFLYYDPAPNHSFFICVHLKSEREFYERKKAAPYNCVCWLCQTSFCFETRDYGLYRALVLTRWLNLGAVLTPEDPQWVEFLYTRVYYDITVCAPSRLKLDGELSVRDCFEKSSSRSWKAMRSRNISYLSNKRYKHVMRRGHSPEMIWYLPVSKQKSNSKTWKTIWKDIVPRRKVPRAGV